MNIRKAPEIPTIELGQDCSFRTRPHEDGIREVVEIIRKGEVVGKIVVNDVRSTTWLIDELYKTGAAP